MQGLVVLALTAFVLTVQGAAPPSDCLTRCNAGCDSSNTFCISIFGQEGCAASYQACKEYCQKGCACLDPCVAGCTDAKLGCEGENPSYTVAGICYTSHYYCLTTCPTVCEVKLEEQAINEIIAQITAYYQSLMHQGEGGATR